MQACHNSLPRSHLSLTTHCLSQHRCQHLHSGKRAFLRVSGRKAVLNVLHVLPVLPLCSLCSGGRGAAHPFRMRNQDELRMAVKGAPARVSRQQAGLYAWRHRASRNARPVPAHPGDDPSREFSLIGSEVRNRTSLKSPGSGCRPSPRVIARSRLMARPRTRATTSLPSAFRSLLRGPAPRAEQG